ncbi:unnamed protein product [Pleuronectes platessa]|uniref:Uncharacterized protein n=1 Tax=Pleuronectes platessa TaxID=8262 RepID=A0A9N7YVA0_PLEPL|nr:unnamed protein product [Pleuronectes platessa]
MVVGVGGVATGGGHTLEHHRAALTSTENLISSTDRERPGEMCRDTDTTAQQHIARQHLNACEPLAAECSVRARQSAISIKLASPRSFLLLPDLEHSSSLKTINLSRAAAVGASAPVQQVSSCSPRLPTCKRVAE